MKVHVFKASQIIPADLDRVFDFFKKPENLEKITPPSLGFKIMTPSPIKMEKGRLIDYTVKIMGLRRRWTTLITEYDPPRSFVDEQLKGPYSFWHHTHTFAPHKEGTLIEDEVRYAVPFGIFGEIARVLLVDPQIKSIFEHRKKIINSLFDISQANRI